MSKVLCFDIERRGKSVSRHGILAVGVVVHDNGKETFRKVWNVGLLPGQVYEEDCLQNFWSKFTETRVRLEKNPVDPSDFAKEFRELLNSFDETNVFLLCDNPSFDAAFINYYLDYFGYDSMSHDSFGRYARVVHDSDSFTRGFLRCPPGTRVWVSNADVAKELQFDTLPSTQHMPDEDAAAILDFHLKLCNSSH
jgi:hypothetical protein